MKTIAVLITVFNRKKQTLFCLQNLFSQILPEGYKLEVFLVDDGCTDGTPEAVEQQFSAVTIIKGNGDLFWNRGMHLAWHTAAKIKEYDFYLWLNDDSIIYKQSVNTLLKTSNNLNNQGIIVGSTAAFKNPNQVTYGGRSKTKGLLVPKEKPIACDYFNGNIVLIPQQVYNKVGTNDPVFHHALGDFDYGLRAGKLGIQSYVAPGFIGQCDVHISLPMWCNPKKTFKQRWGAFRSPLGNNPEEFFVFESRHKGYIKAVFHYCTNHLRVFCPNLWNKK